jgi:hypothetical protein
MPAHRKPTAVLRLTGGFKRHPERERARENEPESIGPIGDPPKRLRSKAALESWTGLVAQAPWATASHRSLLELAARLEVKTQNGTATSTEQRLYFACLAKLCITPSDNSKAVMPKKPAAPSRFGVIRAKRRGTKT